jgi:hypothetical protein
MRRSSRLASKPKPDQDEAENVETPTKGPKKATRTAKNSSKGAGVWTWLVRITICILIGVFSVLYYMGAKPAMLTAKFSVDNIGSQQDKTVVITGGTSGIGQETAIILAAKGARVVLSARNTTKAHATMARVDSPFASMMVRARLTN